MVVESTLDTGVHGMPFSVIEKVIAAKHSSLTKVQNHLKVFFILSEEIVL